MKESGPKIIKRYGNRKLYDTERSCYVTLDDISQMVRKGVEVRVIDNRSKEDLTAATFSQIIFELERRNRTFLPLPALEHLIRNGEHAFGEIQRRFSSGIASLKEETEKYLVHWKRKGREARSWGSESLEETLSSSSSFFKEIEQKLQERIGTLSKQLPDFVLLQAELNDLRERVSSLHGLFEQLEDRLSSEASLEDEPTGGDTTDEPDVVASGEEPDEDGG